MVVVVVKVVVVVWREGGIDELEKLSFENNPFLFWLLTGVGYNF